jgi:hypothetical protein
VLYPRGVGLCNRMRDRVSDPMSERVSDQVSDRMSDRVSDRIASSKEEIAIHTKKTYLNN